MKGGHHLQEERLFDCYLAAKGGEILDPPVAEQLESEPPVEILEPPY